MLDNVALYETATRPPDDASYVVALPRRGWHDTARAAGVRLSIASITLRVAGHCARLLGKATAASRSRWRTGNPGAAAFGPQDNRDGPASDAWIALISTDRYVSCAACDMARVRWCTRSLNGRHLLLPWRRLARHYVGADYRAVQQLACAGDRTLIVAGVHYGRIKVFFRLDQHDQIIRGHAANLCHRSLRPPGLPAVAVRFSKPGCHGCRLHPA